MNLSLDVSVPVLTVFLQGLLSFFSPCVLPLVPVYISYLAGGMRAVDADGTIRYPRKKVMIHTLCFVLGVSFAFFLLGFGFTVLGRFFGENRIWFVRLGAAVMILFGFYQLGLIGRARAVEQERRLPFHLDKWMMNPLTALILGFTFSFAWTPCVGPALASVLLMASSTKSGAAGFLLIGVYSLGFVLPFLAVGVFTGSVLDFFKRHQKVIRYTVKVSGVLLILMGIMTLTGWMNGLTGYLSKVSGIVGYEQTAEGEEGASPDGTEEGTGEGQGGTADSDRGQGTGTDDTASGNGSQDGAAEGETKKRQAVPAPDFTLTDQFGETHTLSDYKGKVVFLNFWATWCGPCRSEMPDIQEIYEDYGLNEEDLVVLGVANPSTDDAPSNSDVSEEEVIAFLEEGGYTYPTVMDRTGEVFGQYYIQAFPTTFMIDADGNVFGKVSGALTRDIMDSIIQQTFDAEPAQEGE